MGEEGVRLRDLAGEVGGTVHGDGDRRILGIQPLESATDGDITFLAHPRYRRAARESAAAAFIVAAAELLPGRNLLVVPDPHLAVARILRRFRPDRALPPVRREAHLGAGCRLGREVSFAAGVVIGDHCRIGDRVRIHAGTVVGDGAEIGDDTVLHANVTVYPGCLLGARVIVHSGTVIGSDGFGYAREGAVYHKIPQVGTVRIEDDVEIGANCAVDRATFGRTVIGRGSKLDNLVQVGHNCRIGEHCAIVAQVGLSGSVQVGDRVAIAGQAGAVGHIVIGPDSRIGARAVVTADVPPGSFLLGYPATDHRAWKRAQAAWNRLPDLLRRLRRLERRKEG
ncbi:MAG: UDP-3-O-(3-hydroxymyristoyl)glucosamine N-acyltransferase [Acidobacteria bacterium]|nr:UDP-3-O-(3-hydroxymyristoyl)glucosamine N-acyltransferase [Acidobacteriota bacterium]